MTTRWWTSGPSGDPRRPTARAPGGGVERGAPGTLRRFSAVLIAGLLWPIPCSGQVLDPSRPFSYDLTSSRLWIDLELTGLYDSNVEQDAVALDSYGLNVTGRIQFKTSARDPLLRLEYRRNLRRFTDTERLNRQTDRFGAELEREAGPVTMEVSGAALLNTTTEDREVGHVYIVQPRASLELGPVEVRADGRYWTKRFSSDPESDERIRGVGGDAGVEIASLAVLRVGYRAEDADSHRASRRFDRVTQSLEVEAGYAHQSHFILELRRQVRTFPERTVETDDMELPTRDVKIIPSLQLRHRAFTGNELILEWEYQDRRSNDVEREFFGHRVSLGFRVAIVGPIRSEDRPPS